MTVTPTPSARADDSPRGTSAAYTAAIALAMLAIGLQGLWAGLFLGEEGKEGAAGSWMDVHARGGEVALVLSAVGTVVAFVRVRSRRELWLGSAALTALLVLEAYLGGLVRDQGKDTLLAVHVPLAMAIMGLAVWLLVRSRRGARDVPAEAVPYPAVSANESGRRSGRSYPSPSRPGGTAP